MAGLRQGLVARESGEEVNSEPFRPDGGGYTSGVRELSTNGSAVWISRLVRSIETEVVPRLVLARGCPASGSANLQVEPWGQDVTSISEFTGIVMNETDGAAVTYAESLRSQGLSVEALYLDLLAPVARQLGVLWDEDACDFSDVTLGLLRLQHVLREFSPAFQHEVAFRDHGRRALLVPVPGEQHTFGLLMVAEFLRRAGWDVWCSPLESRAELIGLVRQQWFGVVGISVSSDSQVTGLASAIQGIRRASRNRAVGVMVGGPVFVEHPELVTRVGADGTASDGRQAALQAEYLVQRLPVGG